jgi:glucosamine-6-phosphate deaminase
MIPQPVLNVRLDDLQVSIYKSNQEMGLAAAHLAREAIAQALHEKGVANVILAAGNSQLTFLKGLRTLTDIDWSKVNFFHMDEYIGLEPGDLASFSLFLRRNLLDYIHPRAFFTIPSQGKDQDAICKDYEQLLHLYPADVCALGIGENGHIAFNDPPYSDFDDPVWVKAVQIDDVSRMQQVKEGHFPSIVLVPRHAITLTIPALLAAQKILVIVPEARKADAVYRSLHGPIVPSCPASILRKTPHARLLLDQDSAAKSLDYQETVQNKWTHIKP